MIKNIQKLILFLIIIAVSLLGGCKKEDSTKEPERGGVDVELEQLKLPEKGEEIAVMETNYGSIKIRLFPNVASKAVENFTTHARNGYYNGLTFHRVIDGFMIQGGDPNGNGTGGESIWSKPFEDEFDINYHNFRGALSMANAGPNTNGSQFFIVQNRTVEESLIEQMTQIGEKGGFSETVIKAYTELGGTPHLDFRHTVFGQVFEGMDIVDKIAAVETDGNGKPVELVIIEKVEIVNY
ncbi:putative peptidyl-prolyl cis-trans isomerase [[Clostridium] ultunense Esp]|uniref:Peptidyl-prolyl cis-trans isomerase n=1 Tax=[Clostridium] ultunense Esp TaxID=1288971 RepID=M1Z444_9FIRM|nr:putative peptidyl-prolyl cis-trans isomerase [[Clostridium] ultunense Esp]SHD75824.1 putative peptidyl-prolyl cis-trans isomerase [[Clostridium] ultunense Esp]